MTLFKKREIFDDSWAAAFQRNPIWNKEKKESDSKKLKESIYTKFITENPESLIIEDYFLKLYNENGNNEKISEELQEKNLKQVEQIFNEIIKQTPSSSKKQQTLSDKIIGGKIKFSVIQKFVNMMCKCYWCEGWIGMPAHFPIDSINISHLSNNLEKELQESFNVKKIKWTEHIKTYEDYIKIIKTFQTYVKQENQINQQDLSLAEWELKNWRRRNNK